MAQVPKGRGPPPHTHTLARWSQGMGTDLLLEPLLPGRRVFYKVKSRSAHMKSHAEQEKKAAALRQREKEAAAAAATSATASPHQTESTGERG